MALTANHVRVEQHGDAMMGEYTQFVYDKETGMAGQKKTVVAQVPVEGGGHAILVTEQVQVTQVGPPSYTPRTNRALQYNDNVIESTSDEPDTNNGVCKSCSWILCSCFIFLMSLAIITPIAVVGLPACAPLSGAASSGLVLGSITFIMSILCCAYCCNIKSSTVQCLCCSAVTLLTLAFLAALIANTVFVAQNINFINDLPSNCSSPKVALAAMSLSWILLPMFGLFCLCSAYICMEKCLETIMRDN
ncbi:uncharacterized protein LOC135349720 isoform X2 [Halichondria panicea]|uniref:uncharacterized protein LOC135349720 isoform X2 n=1 Tax=Halichondria panicea TaxID=6063 RepID=UPI00312BC2CE